KHVKVAIAGDGADELFGSYLSHRLAFPLANYSKFVETGNADLIAPFQNQPDYLKSLYEPEDWRWRGKLLVLSEQEKVDLYHPSIRSEMGAFSSLDLLRRDFENLTARDPLNRILEAEFK